MWRIVWNIRKCARMASFEDMNQKLGANLEKSMEIIVEHSKMRKDVLKLRNHDFKIEFIELDVGFSMVSSKVCNDA